MYNLSDGVVHGVNITLGGTDYLTNLTTEIPLSIANNSGDADFGSITLRRAGNFRDTKVGPNQTWAHPNLRVNQIYLGNVPAGTYFGSDAFGSVTIQRNGYRDATHFETALTRYSGRWIFSPTASTAYPVAGGNLVPERIEISGFLERTRLTLTAAGLKVELLRSGITTTYRDYLRAGFRVSYTNAVELLEIGTDGTFNATESVLGDSYLLITTGLARPRILIRAGAYPVGDNIRITVTAGSPDLVLDALDAGLSLTLTTAARIYLGVTGAYIRQIAGDISTVRFISNAGIVTVFIRELSFTSSQNHFLSDDNGDVTIVVGNVPYTLAGLRSDGHLSVRGSFRFSTNGQVLPWSENITKAKFDSYVANDAPFASLDIAEGGVIRVPVGQTFFVNSSHAFPGLHYYLSLEGNSLPTYNVSGTNKHAVLCAPALVCAKYEVVFKNDPYYTHPSDYLPLKTEYAEEKCYNYSSLFESFQSDAATAGLRCIGYEILGPKRTGIVGTISYDSLGQQISTRAVWAQNLYEGVRQVTIGGGTEASGISLNIDLSVLAGANLTLLPQGNSGLVYFDSTARTPGHLNTLILSTTIQVLSVDLGNLSFGAPNVVFNVAQPALNYSLFNFGLLRSLTIPYGNWTNIASLVQGVHTLTITGFQGAVQNITFNPNGTDVDAGRVLIRRPPGSSLTLTQWTASGSVAFLRPATGFIDQKYDFSLLPPFGAASIEFKFDSDWRSEDSANVTLRCPNITIPLGSSDPLNINFVTGGLHIGFNRGPPNFHFTATVTTQTGNFAITDPNWDIPIVFDHLVWNADSFTHHCMNGSVLMADRCANVIVRNLTINNGFQFDATANISVEALTISGTGTKVLQARQFNLSHLRVHIERGAVPPLVLRFNDDFTGAPAPLPPAIGEIEAVTVLESGDEILARQAAPLQDFPPEAPKFTHLVCSTKFNCTAWKATFAASAAQVRQHSDGTSSTFLLQCSTVNKDVGYAAGDYYKAGSRLENGNFTAWTCLDYREVITGGTPGSPHANFSDDGSNVGPKKKLSPGTIAGIVIGVIAAILLVGLLLYCCCKKKDKDGHRQL